MAQLNILSYRPGQTRLHRLDTRCKLLSFIALGLISLNVGPGGLFSLTLFILMLMGVTRLYFSGIFSNLRHLYLFLGFVWLARALLTPGAELISISFLTITKEGAVEGILICWRMMLVVLLSLVYSVTTRPSQTRDALQRLLKPIPFLPGKRIADMMGLMIRFIPVVLDRIAEIVEAQRTRSVENRKNPIYRIKSLAAPLLRGLFIDANALSEAMEARGYTPDRMPDPIPLEKSDWAALVAVFSFCLLCLIP